MKKILPLAVLILVIAFAMKLLSEKKSQWQGLTEAEVRAMIDARMLAKVPEEKRLAMADKVVSKMRQQGVLIEVDDGGEASDDVNAGATDEATDGAEQE